MIKKEGATIFLRKWTVHYIRNKDILTRKIEQINEIGEDKIFVKAKDKDQYYLIKPFITNTDDIISNIDNENFYNIVLFNTTNNLNVVLNSWDNLIKFPKLTLIFVNPFSQLDIKWILVPYTHNLISDKKSLKLGLKTMFETVEVISEDDLITKIESAFNDY